MIQISNVFKTKTKTFNGLKRELFCEYKLAYDINTTTRVYNVDYDDCYFDFNIEKPSRGRGTISYINDENTITYTFTYTPA
jgi:hypothetical protein